MEAISLPAIDTQMPPKQKVEQATNLLDKPFMPFGHEGEVELVTSTPITSLQTKKKKPRTSLGIGTPKKSTKKRRKSKTSTPKKSKNKS